MQPEMMALGDSLYNGVSSLRINWWLSEWSAPAQVAIPLGLIHQHDMDRQADQRRFWGPQYPARFADAPMPDQSVFDSYYPYAGEEKQLSIYSAQTPQFGFDVEQTSLFRLAAGDLQIGTKNLIGLLDWRPPNGRLLNDNIAFQGADSTDLLRSSAANLRAELEQKPRDSSTDRFLTETTRGLLDDLRKYNAPNANQLAAFAMGFFAINGAYVLNPMRNDCIDGLSPIEQVELRRPKRVLINIGSNNGIWKVAFGYATSLTQPYRRRDRDPETRTIISDLTEAYLTDMKSIVERLNKVPGLRYVYINGLMPPSRAGNMMPADRSGVLLQNPKPVGSDGYYEFYRPVFSLGSVHVVQGSWLKDADILVKKVNARLRETLDEYNAKPGNTYKDGGVKFAYVDLDALTSDYDYKHRGEQAQRITINPSARLPLKEPVFLDNRALALGTSIDLGNGLGSFTHVSAGGLFSFDNMHLTTAGYGLLASTVLRVIIDNEQLQDVLEQQQGPQFPVARSLIDPANHVELRAFRQNNFLRQGTARQYDRREMLFRSLFKVKPIETTPVAAAPPP